MLPFFVSIVIAPILLKAAIRCMSASTHDFMQGNTTQKIDGNECPSSRMAAN